VNCLYTGKLRNCKFNDQINAEFKSHHLLRNHDNCLDRESPVAEVKEILQTWSKEVNDQNVVESFLAKVIDIRYSGYANQWEP
jgi:hypothetical protein